MARRILTDTIVVEGRTHRFNLYWRSKRSSGQREIIMVKGKVVPHPLDRI